MVCTAEIKAAGEYLLDLLKDERAVNYSRFYNRQRGADVALAEEVWKFLVAQPAERRGELDEDDKERLVEEVHVLVEWAAWQLEDLGAVRTTFLEGATLMDGEEDYRIELTERGEQFIASKETFNYRHPERTRFIVKGASEALVLLLDDRIGGPGCTATLRDAMDAFGDDDGIVEDDYGNQYHLGSNTYAWAFEVSLWHHAKEKHIEPIFETDAQREAWERYFREANGHLPRRPEISVPRPLWDVPIRLAEGVDPYCVQHVGRVGG